MGASNPGALHLNDPSNRPLRPPQPVSRIAARDIVRGEVKREVEKKGRGWWLVDSVALGGDEVLASEV